MVAILIALDPNEPSPTWIPVVAFAIPALIVLAVLIPALRSRSRHKAGQKAQRGGVKEESVALGSAAAIGDGATYSVDALRKALAVAPEDHGPVGDLPHNEGWEGSMLGLRSKISSSTTVLEPNLHYGERAQGQVFVRVGPDEKIEGGTTMGTNRHIRQITVLRVATPEFKADSAQGKPEVVEGDLPGWGRVLARMAANDAIWQDLAIQGGPDGIVASRGVITSPGFWVYDLWLLEAAARELKLVPLPDARLGPAWKIPYGLGRKKIDI